MISFDPLLHIGLGPIEVSPHGIATGVGLAVGTWAALPYLRQRGVRDEQVFQVLAPCVVAGLVGARLFYVLNHLGDFGSIGEVLAVWEGGLSLLGGLVPALLLAVVLLHRRRLPVLRLLDGAAPGLAVGIAVGRIGDLLVADHLGKPTSFVLGYVCPSAETASPCVASEGGAVHLTALYDQVGAALIAGVLVLMLRNWHRLPPGRVFFTFAWLYAGVRFVEGFSRLDETHGTGLNGSQWTSLAVLAAVPAVAAVVRSQRAATVPGGRRQANRADRLAGGGPGATDW